MPLGWPPTIERRLGGMRSELLRSLPGFMLSTPLPAGHSGDVVDLCASLMSLTADIPAFFSSLR